MKQLPHILSKLFYEPHLITPARCAAIYQIVIARLESPSSQSEPITPTPEQPTDDTEVKQVADTIIIPVHGVIVPHASDLGMSECGCPLDELNLAIDTAENDTNIKTVIYDFDTPGGTVTGIPETGRKIRNSRKQTIGYNGSQCCSGGLWLAAQCQRFYATQSSRTGSVGVYTMCLDLTGAMKKDGVKVNAISAGKHKLMGAPWRVMTDEERGILQSRVDKIYSQFKDAMESYRIVSDENFGSGLVFDGEESATLGFIDGCVESLDDILDGMVE